MASVRRDAVIVEVPRDSCFYARAEAKLQKTVSKSPSHAHLLLTPLPPFFILYRHISVVVSNTRVWKRRIVLSFRFSSRHHTQWKVPWLVDDVFVTKCNKNDKEEGNYASWVRSWVSFWRPPPTMQQQQQQAKPRTTRQRRSKTRIRIQKF